MDVKGGPWTTANRKPSCPTDIWPVQRSVIYLNILQLQSHAIYNFDIIKPQNCLTGLSISMINLTSLMNSCNAQMKNSLLHLRKEHILLSFKNTVLINIRKYSAVSIKTIINLSF